MDQLISKNRLLVMALLFNVILTFLIFDIHVTHFFVTSNHQKITYLVNEIISNSQDSQVLSATQILAHGTDLQKYLANKIHMDTAFWAVLLVLALSSCLIVFMLTLSGDSTKISKILWKIDSTNDKSRSSIVKDTFNHATTEIRNAAKTLTHLANTEIKIENNKPKSDQLQSTYNSVLELSSTLKFINIETGVTIDAMESGTTRLAGITHQCRDTSTFAAAQRLEWNTLGNRLRSTRKHFDSIQSIASKCHDTQVLSTKNLHQVVKSRNIFKDAIDKVSVHLNKIQDQSESGFDSMETTVTSIEESRENVAKSRKLVKGLSQRAEAIVNIIDVIDDIAEQTNQLALNASIEAARAGEQGQGFAVVAGEVRNLAARSSSATRSITDLLITIQEEAEQASTQLETSGHAVDLAFTKVNSFGSSYRNAVSSTRFGLLDLAQLEKDFGSHMQSLQAIEKTSQEAEKHLRNLQKVLGDNREINALIGADGNQLTVQCDRLSRLMTRQFFELEHCHQLFAGISQLIISLRENIGKAETKMSSIKTRMEEKIDEVEKKSSTIPFNTVEMKKMIQIVESTADTLDLIRLPDSIFSKSSNNLTPEQEDSEPKLEPTGT